MKLAAKIISLALMALLVLSTIVILIPVDAQGMDPNEIFKNEPVITRYQTWEKTEFQDGTVKGEFGLPPFVYDPVEMKYAPHILRVVNSSYTEVQSGMIGWKIGRDNAVITDPNMTMDITKEVWVTRDNGNRLEMNWLSQIVTENATGVYVINSYSITVQPNNAILTITYAIRDGGFSERIVQITGLPGNAAVGLANRLNLAREWQFVNGSLANSIRVDNGASLAIPASASSRYSSTASDATLMVFDNTGRQILRENLVTAGDQLSHVQYNRTKLVFNYANFDSSLRLRDDTQSFAISDILNDMKIETTSATGTSCPGAPYAKTTNSANIGPKYPTSASSDDCEVPVMEWDISTITDGSTITDVDFSFDIASVSNARNCDFMPMTNRPTTAAAADLWTDAHDGTAYLANDSTCTTSGDNKSVDLGSSADTDLQNALTQNWFALAIKHTSESRDGSQHATQVVSLDGTPTPAPTITVTWTPASVTVPITINARSGSDTMETAGVSATVTCTGGGGTHDGNPAQQNFTCNPSTTVTVTMPTDAATSRFRLDTGKLSSSFSSCSSGTCSDTAFSNVGRQFRVTSVLDNADVGNVASVTRQHLGTSSTFYHDMDVTNCAVTFDASNDVMTATDHADIRRQSAMTVFVRFNAYDFSQDNSVFRRILAKTDDASNAYAVAINPSGEIHVSVKSGGVTSSVGSPPGEFAEKTAHNAMFTWDGSTVRLYLDNTEWDEEPTNLTFPSGTNLNVGWHSSTAGRFAGDIYEIRYYNKVLSTAERGKLQAGAHVSDSLLTWYRFDACTGTSVTDQADGDNTGTLAGSPIWETSTWADQGSTITFPNSIVVTADEERYQSYNSTLQRSFTVSAASTKTYQWQKEFYTQFRVHENHTGVIFDPMPDMTLTGTIRTANGTNISGTFVNDDSQDDHAVTSFYWVSNGTVVMPNDLTWRGVVINGTSKDYALRFDGSGDYVTVLHNSAVNLGATTDSYSLVAKFKTSTSTGQSITEKWSSGSGAYPWAMRGPNPSTTGRVQFLIYDGTNNPGCTTPSAYGALNDSDWHTVIGIRDVSADLVKCYVDDYDNNATAADTTTATTANTQNFMLGARTTGGNYWNGDVAFIYLYSRVLSSTEIDQIMAGVDITSGRVAAYRFDEGTGSHATDSSGNANDGTITAATYVDTGNTVSLGPVFRHNSYDTVDMEVTSRHTGLQVGNNFLHFRAAVDNASEQIQDVAYDSDELRYSFNATASGISPIIVEYYNSIFTAVTSVEVNGTPLQSSDYSLQTSGDLGILTINNVAFSENLIEVFFSLALPESGGGGGGGGGGGSGGSGGSLFPGSNIVNPGGVLGPILSTNLFVPTMTVTPGTTRNFTLTVYWSGSDSLQVQSVVFNKNSDWFEVQQELPATYRMPLHFNNTQQLQAEVPISVTVPANAQGVSDVFDITVVSSAGGSSSTDVTQFRLVYASQPLFAWFAVLGVMAIVIGGIAYGALKRKGGASVYRR